MDWTRRRRNRHIFLSGSTYCPYSRARLRLQYQIGTLHRPLRLNLPSNTRANRIHSQPNYSSLQAEIARRRHERIIAHGSGLPSPQPRQQYKELFVPTSIITSGDWGILPRELQACVHSFSNPAYRVVSLQQRNFLEGSVETLFNAFSRVVKS